MPKGKKLSKVKRAELRQLSDEVLEAVTNVYKGGHIIHSVDNWKILKESGFLKTTYGWDSIDGVLVDFLKRVRRERKKKKEKAKEKEEKQ